LCVCVRSYSHSTPRQRLSLVDCARRISSAKKMYKRVGRKRKLKETGSRSSKRFFFFQAIVQPHSKAQSHRKSKFRREIKHCITKQDLKKKNLESQKVPRKDLLIISPFIKLCLFHEGSSLQNSSLFSLSSLRYFTSLTRAQKKKTVFLSYKNNTLRARN
jgi:hypothetical protein